MKTFLSLVACILLTSCATAPAVTQTATVPPTTATTPSPSPPVITPTVKATGIGAVFPGDIQIKSANFTPVITRERALTDAQILVRYMYVFGTYPVVSLDAEMALFSGQVMPTQTRSSYPVNDLRVWVVVVKVPAQAAPTTMYPMYPKGIPAQANVIVDATTGELLYCRLSWPPEVVLRFPPATPAPPLITPTPPPASGFPPATTPATNNTSTPHIETSRYIGWYGESGNYVKDTSFVPTITRDQAIATAKKYVLDVQHIAGDLPANASVSLYSREAGGPAIGSPPAVTDLKVWLVVVRDGLASAGRIPGVGEPPGRFYQRQVNVVIDATTGELVYALIGGTEVMN